jgi:hypothetical protein
MELWDIQILFPCVYLGQVTLHRAKQTQPSEEVSMKKHILIVVLVVIALTVTIGVAAASNSRTVFRAGLEPVAGTGSAAHGNAVVKIRDDGSDLSYKLIVNGLENTLMAHIHVAAEPGGNGPPVLWLYPDAPPPQLIEGTFNGLLGSRTATSADLTGSAGIESLDALRAAIEEGRAYVNVHTTANPGGEIRGTLD